MVENTGKVKTALVIAAIAAVYIVGSKLGFALAFTAEQVTAVWPPTGIALASLLLLGYRVWPAIMIGAFVSDILFLHLPIPVSFAIAAGNTFAGLASVWMLKNLMSFDISLHRVRDVMSLMLYGSCLNAMLSATIGVISLYLGGMIQPGTSPLTLWSVWWLGDASGAFIFAPVLLVWGRPPYFLPPARMIFEMLLLTAGFLMVCANIYAMPRLGFTSRAHLYPIFPFIIWGALRFGQRATTILAVGIATMAIWAELRGFSPFSSEPLDQSVILLDAFLLTVSATGLLLSAVISERENAQQQMLSNKGLLSAIVESSFDPIVSKTLDGVITSWNEGARRLFGYTDKEAIGKNIRMIIPSDRQDEELRILRQIRRGHRIEPFETIRRTKSGEMVPVSITISPIRDSAGRIIGASKIARDIRERQEATKKLQAAHQYLTDILNHIPDAIFMKDRGHHLIGGNKALWEYMGGPPENFIGKSDAELVPAEEAKAFEESDDRAFTTGEVINDEEHYTDGDGTRHTISVRKTVFTNESGNKILIGVARDVTQLKKTEEQILKYTRELERSNQELDDFSYIVSHDLKEPLRGLQSFSHFLLEDYADKLDAEGKKKLEMISSLTQRLEEFLDALLHYSRLGRTQVAIEPTDLNEVVEKVINLSAIKIREAEAKIEICGKLPTITCDRVRIAEVFQNLISNALKYTDKKGQKIEVCFTDRHPRAPGETVFYVRDHGIGIPQKHLEIIFKIFKRLHPKGAYGGGTGSGLTICKKIISQHGGQIWAESGGEGMGTTFYFTIPQEQKPWTFFDTTTQTGLTPKADHPQNLH